MEVYILNVSPECWAITKAIGRRLDALYQWSEDKALTRYRITADDRDCYICIAIAGSGCRCRVPCTKVTCKLQRRFGSMTHLHYSPCVGLVASINIERNAAVTPCWTSWQLVASVTDKLSYLIHTTHSVVSTWASLPLSFAIFYRALPPRQ